MKAFRFRLDQALRWRATQLDLEKAKLSAATHHLVQLNESMRQNDQKRIAGAAEIANGDLPGQALALWGAFTDRSRREFGILQMHARDAEKAILAQTGAVADADRRLRLLENLRDGERAQWQAELNRELEAFAGESYLFRLQLKNRRARSSGG